MYSINYRLKIETKAEVYLAYIGIETLRGNSPSCHLTNTNFYHISLLSMTNCEIVALSSLPLIRGLVRRKTVERECFSTGCRQTERHEKKVELLEDGRGQAILLNNLDNFFAVFDFLRTAARNPVMLDFALVMTKGDKLKKDAKTSPEG